MNLRLAALCWTVVGLMPLAAMAQGYAGDEPHFTPSVVRPVGYGPLWDDYDGGCGCGSGGHGHGLGKGGCCGPVGCPYGVAGGCGCGGKYRIACGLPLAFNRITRSLDCLLPCRPKLLGCGSGWGGCSPCYDPSCGGGCPKPHFARRFGGFGGCSKDCSNNCNLDCTCGSPAATFGTPTDIPAPPADSKVNPFQDDPPEPMPTDARRNPSGRSHFSNGPTPARRPTHHQASTQRMKHAAPATLKTVPRVQRAAHTASNEAARVQQASAESDDVIRNYTNARSQAVQSMESQFAENDELPHNPLR